jgi:hypothetical protein
VKKRKKDNESKQFEKSIKSSEEISGNPKHDAKNKQVLSLPEVV